MTANTTDNRLVSVTPHLARTWLKDSMWQKQRTLRPWHVLDLAEAMKRGEFTKGTQIHFARLNGDIHNINGRHTLEAVVMANRSIELSILTTKVSTDAEIADLYSRHDRHLPRTLSDSYEAHGIAAESGLSRAQVDKIGAGIAAIIGNFSANRARDNRTYKMRSSDERIRQMNTYVEEGKAFFNAIKGAPTSISAQLRTGNIIGIALLTYKIDRAKADSFWSQVAFCDGLNIGDPRKTLMNWLVADQHKKANGTIRSRIVANAWNGFVEGRVMSRFKTPDISVPIVLQNP